VLAIAAGLEKKRVMSCSGLSLQCVRSRSLWHSATVFRLPALGVGWAIGVEARCGASPGPADGAHLPASSTAAEEPIAAVGLEPRNHHSGWHLKPLQDSRFRIDSPHVAFAIFPGAVPEFSVDLRHTGDEAVGLDRAKNRACLGIDLMDLPVPILTHPSVPSADASPESLPPPGAGIVASTWPDFGSIFWMRSAAS
jgi:hypothetical protein